MKPRATDSLETVEVMVLVEDVFEIEIPDAGANRFDRPGEIADWLEVRLSNQRPNKAAQKLLRRLAVEQLRPELAKALHGLWRREQIAAIVREIFSSFTTR